MNTSFKLACLGAGLLGMQANCPADAKAKVAEKPNVLIFIADDSSFPYASAYGTNWLKTPGFDRVAEEGILFNNGFTPNAKSAPSRACLLTGQYSWQLEDIGNHCAIWPEGRFITVMEHLSANGYLSAYTGKGWGPGRTVPADRPLTGASYHQLKVKAPAKYMSSEDYAGNFEQFLDQKEKGKPWIFWCGTREPHRPYEYEAGKNYGGLNPDDVNDVPAYLPDNNTVRTDFTDYAFEIQYLDSHLVKILDILEDKGELDNTLIIVTADNGMPFPRCKGNQYHTATHLPLAMMWRDGIKNPGRAENDYVSFVDIVPTILKISGVEAGEEMHPSGREMTDIFKDKKNKDRTWISLGQERHDCGRPGNQSYPIRSIIDGEFMYINNMKSYLWPVCNPETGYLNTDGSPTKTEILEFRRNDVDNHYWQLSFGKRPAEELYNIVDDPDCMVNLAELPKYKKMMAQMKKKLYDYLIKTGDPRMGDDGDVFDRYRFHKPENWNFYERYMNGEIKGHITNWCNPSDYEKELLD